MRATVRATLSLVLAEVLCLEKDLSFLAPRNSDSPLIPPPLEHDVGDFMLVTSASPFLGGGNKRTLPSRWPP